MIDAVAATLGDDLPPDERRWLVLDADAVHLGADARELQLRLLDGEEALDGLGETLWLAGDIEAAIARREEAYAELRRAGELVEVEAEVDPYLEITEILDRTVKAGGPALLFRNPKGSEHPLLANQFGTERRMAMAFGEPSLDAVGKKLGDVLEMQPPQGVVEKVKGLGKLKRLADSMPRSVRSGPVQELVLDPDLDRAQFFRGVVLAEQRRLDLGGDAGLLAGLTERGLLDGLGAAILGGLVPGGAARDPGQAGAYFCSWPGRPS